MVCPECKQEIESVDVSFESAGSGVLQRNKKNEIEYVEYENMHEKEEYTCPKCNYEFQNREEAEKAIGDLR